MKTLSAFLSFGLAFAAAQLRADTIPRPAQIFGEATLAPLDAELARWNKTVRLLSPTATPITHEQVVGGIGKVVGVPLPEGIDLRRPIGMLLVDPRSRAKPIVLVVEVLDESKFARATVGLPADIAVRRRKHIALLGDPAVLTIVGDYAFSRLRDAAKEGIHVRAFTMPLWDAFGLQATALEALFVGQASANGAISSQTIGQVYEAVLAGLKQSTELDVDGGATPDGLDVSLRFVAQTGTAVDQFFARQRSSDFALVGKLPDVRSTYIAGGHLDMSGIDAFADWLFGANADPKARELRASWMRLASGDIAMAGNGTKASQSEVRYLLRSPEVPRVRGSVAEMFDAMTGGMLGGLAKVKRIGKPATSYDGLVIANDDLDYDMSKVTKTPDDAHFVLARAWTTWDDLFATSSGVHAAEDMRTLVDAARHGTGILHPNASMRASLDKARARKESFWMSLDFSAIAAAAGKPSGLPANMIPTLSVGFSEHAGWLRFALAPK